MFRLGVGSYASAGLFSQIGKSIYESSFSFRRKIFQARNCNFSKCNSLIEFCISSGATKYIVGMEVNGFCPAWDFFCILIKGVL